MAKQTRIQLHEPFEMFGRRVEEVTLREPTGWEAATLGEPRTLVHSAAGAYFVEQSEILARYLEKCVEHQSGADIFKLVGLVDALRIKQALFDFFTDAEAKIAQEKLKSFASERNAPQSVKSDS